MPSPLPPPLSELETRLGLEAGSLSGTDKARAEAALEDASTLVLAEVAELTAERWEADAPKPAVLVVLKAARREYENPRGIAQETFGEHTVGLTESSGVYLTGREVAQIIRAATKRRSGVGSVRTPSAYGEGGTVSTLYAPVSGDGKPVPYLAFSDLVGG